MDSRVLHCIARKCAGTGGGCSVSGHKHAHRKASKSRSELCFSRGDTRPHRLSFALAMILTMNARRFQRTHPFSEMGSALSASKDIAIGVNDVALVVNQIQLLTHVVRQWLTQLALAYVKLVLIARTDLLTYAALVTRL